MALTEDQVRDNAQKILGFDATEAGIIQGTGQITTFNHLGFPGVNYEPDGWYLPQDLGLPAIILETKAQNVDIKKNGTKGYKDLMKNIDIVRSKYTKVIGILYNGVCVRVFKNTYELTSVSQNLESKSYYIKLYTQDKLDKEHIYQVTKRINDNLHFKFGMTNLQDRMIFTACALVAQRYNPQNGLQRLKGMGYNQFHTWIHDTLDTAISSDMAQNAKLNILLKEFSIVSASITNNQDAINSFINDVCDIADLVNSDNWNGEDVMAIFFNEFNRYRRKTDAGQVFTPDHVTSFMYRLIDVNLNDRVLDATCGSGAFLVKSMCNMIKEAGGVNTEKAKEIKARQLYGIEMYQPIYALACANMLIHKDGKTNLLQEDAKSEAAANWIADKHITKVLMNPPYERKYKCADIVCNVLDKVPAGTKCAIIMPDKKIEKERKLQDALKKHTVTTIIKMPENLFFGIGVTTSIFIFETGRPQNGKSIIGYYLADDGLETVKNEGRHDTKNRWQDIEDYWIKAIHDGNDCKYDTRQIINPNEHLSYQMPVSQFEISEKDFKKSIMDSIMHEKDINVKTFKDALVDCILYNGDISKDSSSGDVGVVLSKQVPGQGNVVDTSKWEEFQLGGKNGLFDIVKGKRLTKANMIKGDIPFVGSSAENNGVTAYIGNADNMHNGNLITVSYNGSVGEAFYQEGRFVASDDVNVLYPKFNLNKKIALFLCPLIKKAGEKFGYIDKWRKEEMEKSTIKLPVLDDGNPDWKYIENFIDDYKKKTEEGLNDLSSIL